MQNTIAIGRNSFISLPLPLLGPGSFAGYYTFHLPERCWDSKGEKLLNDESWASERAVTCTDVGARKVTKVTSGEDRKGAWSVLDVSHDIIVAQFSTPNTAPQLVRYG